MKDNKLFSIKNFKIEKIQMIITIVVFVIFFIAMIFQHKYMWIYQDDYGYLSLSYEYNVENVSGHDFNFFQIIDFLIGHYNKWGGRVLAFLVEYIFYFIGGLTLLKIAQAIIIVLILFCIYLIAKDKLTIKNKSYILAIFSVACYGMFNIFTLRTGIYWFAASVLYVFPMLWLILFIYLYTNLNKKKIKNKTSRILYTIMCGVLLFFASFSQEQIGIAAVTFIIMFTGFNIFKNKKLNKIDIIMNVVSLIGFIILMIAPGNALRQLHPTSIEFYNLSLIEKICKNVPEVILGNFSKDNMYFTNILFIFSIIVSIICLKQKLGNKLTIILNIISSLIIILGMYMFNDGYFKYIFNISEKGYIRLLSISVIIIQLILAIYSFLIYLYNKKDNTIICVLIAGILSQAAMVMSPYFASRCSIPFEYCMFIVFGIIISNLINEYGNVKLVDILLKICVLVLFIISMENIIVTIIGYKSNYDINVSNDKVLVEASQKIKNGEDIDKIYLDMSNSILYSGELPYVGENQYIYYWMKNYYDIPIDVEFIYE